MKRYACRRWVFVSIIAVAVGLMAGCNVLAPFYFAAIIIGMDPRLPPKMELPPDAGRVVVITNADHGTQIGVGPIDRELNELISRKLYDSFQVERKMKDIQVITASTVVKWQDEHDDWRSLEPVEIGRALNADYVIYVRIEEINFYQDHGKMLMQGNADVTVKVIKVDDAEGEVVMPEDPFTLQFPKGRPIPVGGDITFPKFRRMVLNRIAEYVVWYFVPHEGIDEFGRDPF